MILFSIFRRNFCLFHIVESGIGCWWYLSVCFFITRLRLRTVVALSLLLYKHSSIICPGLSASHRANARIVLGESEKEKNAPNKQSISASDRLWACGTSKTERGKNVFPIPKHRLTGKYNFPMELSRVYQNGCYTMVFEDCQYPGWGYS